MFFLLGMSFLLGWSGLSSGHAYAAGWPPTHSTAPALFAEQAAAAPDLWLEISAAPGLIPRFEAAERDRYRIELSTAMWVSERVHVGVRLDGIYDRLPSGTTALGPGDFRLDTWILPVYQQHLHVGLGWRVKLPNAQDEGGLGTDETDALIALGAEWLIPGQPVSVAASQGLNIMGDPKRFANQDDIPVSQLSVRYHTAGSHGEGLQASLRSVVEWKTSRNPVQASLLAALERGCPWRYGIEGGAGLTPAAADLSAQLWLGWSGACRLPSGE